MQHSSQPVEGISEGSIRYKRYSYPFNSVWHTQYLTRHMAMMTSSRFTLIKFIDTDAVTDYFTLNLNTTPFQISVFCIDGHESVQNYNSGFFWINRFPSLVLWSHSYFLFCIVWNVYEQGILFPPVASGSSRLEAVTGPAFCLTAAFSIVCNYVAFQLLLYLYIEVVSVIICQRTCPLHSFLERLCIRAAKNSMLQLYTVAIRFIADMVCNHSWIIWNYNILTSWYTFSEYCGWQCFYDSNVNHYNYCIVNEHEKYQLFCFPSIVLLNTICSYYLYQLC